ncbi:MAG TPA: cellulase family glycosylhydrolase [Pyrinomonadaceae bacterium]|nr:cellulase family glycosylhydrolase [Pyrinomonadaceae bacterium]
MAFRPLIIIAVFIAGSVASFAVVPKGFVSVKGHALYRDNAPYYFVGANYWYGSLLGLEKDKKRGVERLRRELDFLKAHGVTNLRLMAGAEGTGLLNGVTRVGPSLQPSAGKFDESILDGLDLMLYEMSKRRMTAVIFLSNNWEWSGGFQQYLIWNGMISDKWLTAKPTWDELRDNVAKFYSCTACKAGYDAQVKIVLSRRNKYSGKRYIDDPTIMAWELANEPRPMRPAANDAYAKWIADSAAMIKKLDPNHLVTTGHEGRIGTESLDLYKMVHTDPNIDYLTIHIWPKNWGWFTNGKMAQGFNNATRETDTYISENLGVAVKLEKPLVIEEFGLPRDGQSFSTEAGTTLRDKYFGGILSLIGGRTGGNSYVAGANFWAFGGTARPRKGQLFWKPGDELMGDPPMEEQGLNSVFDSDISTWQIIKNVSRSIGKR